MTEPHTAYLLDTNACVRFLNGRAPGVMRRLALISDEDVVTCSVVKAELFHGAMKSTNPVRTLADQIAFLSRFRSLPFDDRAAEVYGRIRPVLEAHGTPIGPNDLMIAAIAIANGVTLVTHNVREFGRVPGLSVEDWEAAG